MRHRNRKWFVFFPLLFIAAAFLFGWIVMLLWNAILVPAAGTGALTIWQGMGILVLSRILFGGFHGRGWQNRRSQMQWKEKWMNMSEEERKTFQEKWKHRCGGRFSGGQTESNVSPSKQEGVN